MRAWIVYNVQEAALENETHKVLALDYRRQLLVVDEKAELTVSRLNAK